MKKEEAIAIAMAFVEENRIPFQGIETVFFVPVSAFDYQPPGLTDSWCVHFRIPLSEDRFNEWLLSSEPGLMIVSINAITGVASFVSTL
jgi:hypothetical protein